MALTEAEETALKDGLKASNEALAKLTPALAALQTSVAEKDKVITDLQSKTNVLSQDAATNALKAKFPDVPLETLMALPEAAREAQGKVLQDSIGKLKTSQVKTGSEAWANVGGVGPTAEAEDHAALTARETARESAVQKGDLMGLLRVKSRDTIEFVHKNFASR